MPYIKVGKENLSDIEIYHKDWGSGQPIVFHHGWPLSSDDWDAQMLYFVEKGYRVKPEMPWGVKAGDKLLVVVGSCLTVGLRRLLCHEP